MKSAGEHVGKYVIDRRLGAGGMAEAYLAHTEGIGGFHKRVVVKVLHPFHAANEKTVAAFLREAKVGAQLNHVNIVHIFDVGEDSGEKFIAMEYVDGLTLQEATRRCWKTGAGVPVDVAVRVAAAAATGLDHAHTTASVVHRDVSPDNIIIAKDGTVKLLDFGVAKLSGADATKSGDAKGKVPFMAPEQLEGGDVDARTDVWSLGVTLYWCLAGRRPFVGDNELGTMRAILEDEPPPLRARCPAASPELESLVRNMLARNPKKRIENAALCADKLRDLVPATRDNPVGAFVAKMLALDVESLPRTTGGYAAVKLPDEPSADLTQVKPLPSSSDASSLSSSSLTLASPADLASVPATGSGVFARPDDDTTKAHETPGLTVVETAMIVKPDLSSSDGVPLDAVDPRDALDPPSASASTFALVHDPDITQDDGSTQHVPVIAAQSKPTLLIALAIGAVIVALALAGLVVARASSQPSSSESRSK